MISIVLAFAMLNLMLGFALGVASGIDRRVVFNRLSLLKGRFQRAPKAADAGRAAH